MFSLWAVASLFILISAISPPSPSRPHPWSVVATLRAEQASLFTRILIIRLALPLQTSPTLLICLTSTSFVLYMRVAFNSHLMNELLPCLSVSRPTPYFTPITSHARLRVSIHYFYILVVPIIALLAIRTSHTFMRHPPSEDAPVRTCRLDKVIEGRGKNLVA